MSKQGLIYATCLFITSSLYAREFSCPPHNNLSLCKDAADSEYDRCRNDMRDYLHDPDNFTNKSYAYQKYNYGCAEEKNININKCESTCR